jgi:hypothetical protein
MLPGVLEDSEHASSMGGRVNANMGNSRRKKPATPAESAKIGTGSLLDTVKDCFTPEVVHRGSSMTGETEGATRRTLEASAGKLIGGLSRMASSPGGERSLQALLQEDKYASIASNVPALFSGGNITRNAAISGDQLVGRIFGSDALRVTEQLASVGRVRLASAGKLMALVASLTLGLAKRASSQGLKASAIASLLQSGEAGETSGHGAPPVRQSGPVLVPRRPKEREHDVRSLPEAMSHTADDVSETGTDPQPEPVPDPHMLRRILFILAALAALALFILLLVRGPVHRTSHDERQNLASRHHPRVFLRASGTFHSGTYSVLIMQSSSE